MPNSERNLSAARGVIYDSPNKRMTGSRLRQLRVAAGLSESELAERLGTYRRRIQRWEKSAWFELHNNGMNQLLKSLGMDNN